MAGTSKQGTVALKMVSPTVPKGADEKAMLDEDLTQMGCHGLLMRPWCIKYEKIVQELQRKQSNQWAGTIWRDPDLWTAAIWTLEEGLRFFDPRRGHGDMGGEICRREICQPTTSQGRILPTGMHGSESKAGPGVSGPYSVPREAGKSNRHCGEYPSLEPIPESRRWIGHW